LANQAHPVRGYLYIATATLFWGISATLGRAAFTGRLHPGGHTVGFIDPLILAQTRTTFSFFVFLLILVPRRGWRKFHVPLADVARMLVLGVLGVAVSNYFYYLAIQKTNVATAIILQYTAPVWVLLYMVFRGLQKPTLQRLAGVALALAGIAMVIGIFEGGGLRLNVVGVSAAMVAAFSFSFYNIGGHYILARYDRWTVLLYTTFAAALFWIIINSPGKIMAAHYTGPQWIFLFVFSMLSVLVPFSFYFAGLQHLEPTRAIIVSCLEPVFSIVIAAIALKEVLRPLQTVGILMVLAAILVVQTSEPGRKRSFVEPLK
jgi:drug/metabolite transporter, DME family